MNRELPEASFAKLMLEGEGDTFWFSLKQEMLTAHRMRVICQIENYEPLALRS
jgi:hypothetical protein